ncbi:MAG: FtsK/SpoIIIE domain-containing protein [Thermoguttaceae bacterium]
MSETPTTETPRRLLSDLCRLVADRAGVETELQRGFVARNEAVEREFQESQSRLDERYRTEKTATETEFNEKRTAAIARFESEHGALEKEYTKIREGVLARFAADQQASDQALQDAHWEAIEASDAARGGLNLPLKDILAALDDRWQQLENLHKQAVELLQRRGHWDEFPPDAQPIGVILERHPGRRFCHALEQAQMQFRTLSKQFLPKLFQSWHFFGILLLLWLVAVGPSIAMLGWNNWHWAAVSVGAAALVGLVAGIWIYHIAKRNSVAGYLALRRTLLEAGLTHPGVLEAAKSECQRLDASIIARHKTATVKADELHAAAMAKIERRKQADLQRAEEIFPKRMAELVAWRDRIVQEIDRHCPPRLQQIEEHYRDQSQRIQSHHDQTLEESRQRFEREWNEMAERWRSGMAKFDASVAQLDETCREAFPDWNSDDWNRWTLSSVIPAIIPFGSSRVRLTDLAHGVPDDERLQPSQVDFTLPALLPYPRRSSLILKADGTGRARAVEVMQTAMLRMLTSLPPGKVRFTIFDPVGLGDNFSVFMHLADFDEQLVASRIWTDQGHIEQQLADLTKHMENVIQVYLRQEFHSIEEYNAFAGEMAEPYRVLVIANFPTNFSEAALHRIKSIAASGARCGVFVLMSVDTKLPGLGKFQLSDLEADAMTLHWTEGRFETVHPEFGPLTIQVDSPPQPERFKEILRTVGTAAKDSGRVEVPFSCIIPEPADWWTSDSRAGIDVPLGRAGAMKLQSLDLGAGTSQHVLISGKTGSGKSTLLHVLITNLALRYSPDEVQLYLVDFKKGVEFKAYARSELPHARVVAIESEREFGLSVLQRLDAELRTRGDLFRRLGVQDLKGYRASQPDAVMPRILLIIDEFQELFVEDDRIGQESALLLDRLVRQGRAFGIHVLLGSQTLGGAYTLARSTIGQMAVRIALQCSEADAHLILSEDNTAARLLSRPGEAIYNDANGLYEGNHPFQVVWLPDGDRDDYLRQIHELAVRKGCKTPPPIVFEGNVLADPSDNPQLKELLDAPTWPEPLPTTLAWLGSAVAIKEPTSAAFVRQDGSNLLMVGHREEAALGVLASCLMSLAVQLNPHPGLLPKEKESEAAGPRFFVFDGMRADAPEVGFWKRLADAIPQSTTICGVRESSEAIATIAAEMTARRDEGRENAPPIYLFLYNLGRFRDLKKEDDFGFSSGDQPTPAKQFSAILREGPAVGIHTLAWCDTFSNASRMLDRQNMRDFEMRVLFQMNANDSSSLMDTPEASRLGVHRALLYDEAQGNTEKFRPYGLPSAEWLVRVKQQLNVRNGG